MEVRCKLGDNGSRWRRGELEEMFRSEIVRAILGFFCGKANGDAANYFWSNLVR